MTEDKLAEYARENDTLKEILCNGFGWGFLDVEDLGDRLRGYLLMDDENHAGDLADKIEEIDGKPLEVNSWFWAVMELWFFAICDAVEKHVDDNFSEEEAKEIKAKLEKLKDDFSPFINCLDTHFNNCFDELDYFPGNDEPRDEYRERIIEKAVKLLQDRQEEAA